MATYGLGSYLLHVCPFQKTEPSLALLLRYKPRIHICFSFLYIIRPARSVGTTLRTYPEPNQFSPIPPPASRSKSCSLLMWATAHAC